MQKAGFLMSRRIYMKLSCLHILKLSMYIEKKNNCEIYLSFVHLFSEQELCLSMDKPERAWFGDRLLFRISDLAF